eukprot:3290350-Pyramimonas_sp.AAC.1
MTPHSHSRRCDRTTTYSPWPQWEPTSEETQIDDAGRTPHRCPRGAGKRSTRGDLGRPSGPESPQQESTM